MQKYSRIILMLGALSAAELSIASVSAASVQASTPTAVPTTASAATAAKIIDLKQMPQPLIEQVTQEVVSSFGKRPSNLSAAEARTYNQQVIERTIAPVVDFPLIAKRVMAGSYKTATPAQREAFVKAFRESLLATYTEGMATYSNQKIELQPFSGVNEQNGLQRAVVNMKVYGSDGKVYPAVYAMYKNEKGEWKLENLTLNGVNLGLTFRNQFSEMLKQNKGDIEKVVVGWNAKAAAF